jgi:ankyrin repeat protein
MEETIVSTFAKTHSEKFLRNSKFLSTWWPAVTSVVQRFLLAILVFSIGLTACDAQKSPTISLYLATQRGDLDQLERHLHWESDINQPFPDGHYPLHVVAAQGRLSLLQALLDHQAVLEVQDAAGYTPLERAILAGHIQVAKHLQQAGATFQASKILLIAAEQGLEDRDIVIYLVEQGADLEAINAAGDTPLLIAIQQRNHRLVAHLLAQGANVNAQNAEGRTALQLAQAQQLIEVQQRLRRYGAYDRP